MPKTQKAEHKTQFLTRGTRGYAGGGRHSSPSCFAAYAVRGPAVGKQALLQPVSRDDDPLPFGKGFRAELPMSTGRTTQHKLLSPGGPCSLGSSILLSSHEERGRLTDVFAGGELVLRQWSLCQHQLRSRPRTDSPPMPSLCDLCVLCVKNALCLHVLGRAGAFATFANFA